VFIVDYYDVGSTHVPYSEIVTMTILFED